MSPFWIPLELRMMVVVATGATRRAKLQSRPSFFAGLMPFLLPNQQRKSTEGKVLNDILSVY